MDTYSLTAAEHWAVQYIRNGEEANFDIYSEKHFRAETLRRLMLCLPVEGFPNGVPLTGMGVRLKCATISGLLNLEHGALADGSAMPRLSLEGCTIRGRINLKAARLRRLCLKDAHITEVLADHIHISGLLDIRGVKPLTGLPNSPAPLEYCRLSFCGARIEDGIEAAGAHLIAPPADYGYTKYSERSKYALDLPEAHLNGDLRLFPDFTAIGGLNLNGAHIKGSVQMHGAHLTEGQMYALDACGAIIDGDLALDTRVVSKKEHDTAGQTGLVRNHIERFVCEGQLRLNNTTINENLRLFGAAIIGENGRIAAEQLTVKGDVSMCAYDSDYSLLLKEAPSLNTLQTLVRFECAQRIDMRGTEIGGDLVFRGAYLNDDLDISNARIGGHVRFSPHEQKVELNSSEHTPFPTAIRFYAEGVIKMSSTKISGNLNFDGAELKSRLRGYGLQVGGYANFSPFVPKHNQMPIWRFTAHDKVNLENAVFGRNVEFVGAQIFGEFVAPNLRVGGQLLMRAFTPANERNELIWFEAHRRVTVSGADIESNFDLTGARLLKGLRFRGGVVQSALMFDLYGMPGEEVLPKDRYSIDLFNTQVSVLSDLHFWSSAPNSKSKVRLGYDDRYFLRLEGFTYGRFPHYADEESLGEDEKSRRANLRQRIAEELNESWHEDIWGSRSILPSQLLKLRYTWLNLQYRGVKNKENKNAERKPDMYNYNPDPYNTLYKFYKKMGAQTLADDVLYNKLKTERIIDYKRRFSILWLIEKLFGYGLKPEKATVSYFIFVAIVTYGVWQANPPSLPTTNEILSFSFFQDKSIGRLKVVDPPQESFEIKAHTPFDIPPKKPIPCNQDPNIANVVGYAMEMVVPSLDLTQKRYCDFTPESSEGWRTFKLFATLLGWIFTPMLVLTWSGLLRRNLEP